MNAAERPRSVFAWREPLLHALRCDPTMSRACQAAKISRNSAYSHIRRYPSFRRQVERAVDHGREAEYRIHRQQLACDPSYQRAMQRAEAALRFWAERADVTG